ncbi:MAG: hypothetical protein R2789_14980 [Microthrixaceae bacterium]
MKIAVGGEVEWDGEYSVTVDGDERVISTNAVPHDHTTGEFPVDLKNRPTGTTLHRSEHNRGTGTRLPGERTATMSAEPECMGGEAGGLRG